MSYSSIFFDDTGNHIYRSGITEEEITTLKKDIQRLRCYMNEIDYIQILRDNIYECLKCFETTKINDENSFVNINRHMMNWLNSFYGWIEHHEKNYNDIFSSLKRKYYDGNFEYRLAYELRSYTVHQGLGVTKIDLDILNKKMTFPINIEDLSECKKGNSKFRKELSHMVEKNNTVDAFGFVKKFLIIIERFQGEIWSGMQASIDNTFNNILEYVKHDDLMIYESYICVDKDNICFSVGSTIILFMKKLKSIPVPKKLNEYIDSIINPSEVIPNDQL